MGIADGTKNRRRSRGKSRVAPTVLNVSASNGRWVVTRSAKPGRFSPLLRKGARRAEGSAVVEEFPRIGFRGPEHRAYLLGTSLDVWEVIEARNAMGLAALLAEGDLPRKKVLEAIRYYKRHPEEIDRAIAENAEMEASLRETSPGLFAPLA